MTNKPTNPFEPMTLENVGDGRAVELFESALADIRLDLEDADKDPEARRQFTLVVDFIPGASPHEPLQVVVGSKVKLANKTPRRTYATRGPRGEFIQYRNIQEDLPLAPVTPIQEDGTNGDH